MPTVDLKQVNLGHAGSYVTFLFGDCDSNMISDWDIKLMEEKVLYMFVQYGCFQKIGIPQNGWFVMENPIEMDDLGVPLFSETPICSVLKWWVLPLLYKLENHLFPDFGRKDEHHDNQQRSAATFFRATLVLRKAERLWTIKKWHPL